MIEVLSWWCLNCSRVDGMITGLCIYLPEECWYGARAHLGRQTLCLQGIMVIPRASVQVGGVFDVMGRFLSSANIGGGLQIERFSH